MRVSTLSMSFNTAPESPEVSGGFFKKVRIMLSPKDIFKKEVRLDILEVAVQLLIICVAIYSVGVVWDQYPKP